VRFLRVKNWADHQHYKDRLPPWIKLHRALLDDYSFLQLSDDARSHLMLIWLLASHTDGRIPYDEKYVREKIGAKKRIDLPLLIRSGWLIDEHIASDLLAERVQVADDALADGQQHASGSLASRAPAHSRETETYKATEAETEKESRELPAWLPRQAWKDFCDYRRTRKGFTTKAHELCLRELTKLQSFGNDPVAVIERSIANGWTGLFPLPGCDPPPSRKESRTRSEARARNMEILTGRTPNERTVEGVAERMGGAVVLPLPGDLREPDSDDVGRRGPDRSASGVG
jgi:hypothetical protein